MRAGTYQLMLISMCISGKIYADGNPFQVYDNNLMLGYNNTIYDSGNSSGGFNLQGEALLDVGIWLSGTAGYMLYYNRSSSVLNKVTGANLGISAGYAFPVANNRINLIPYATAQHIGQSLSTGYDMSQVDYIDGYGVGFISEYDVIQKTLKLRLNLGVMAQNTKTSYVSPENYPDTSSQNSLWVINPSIQWNITKIITSQFSYGYSINSVNSNLNANVFNIAVGIVY